jgi:hypothetical protein
MTNLLLLLAVVGMLVGVYAVAMPTLTRKGWRLPFAGFFGDADDGEDEEFKTPFDMPRASDVPVILAPAIVVPVEVPEPLPPVVSINLDEVEDDPALTPLFEELVAEVTATDAAPAAQVPVATEAPHLTLVHSQPVEAVPTPEAAVPGPLTEEPQPNAVAPDSNDMMSLFAEDSDAGKGPNPVREAVGDVTITDLMEEVRKLREILENSRAA